MKIKELKIGNIRLKNNLFLAPMVDVTDMAYREICRKAGAGMAYTEMIYIDAILHENKKTKKLMMTSKGDKPIGLQITGNNEDEFAKFAKLKELKNYDLIDINCGCPSIKITGNEAGSFLLRNPSKIGRMIKLLKKEGHIVTAKIRLGFDKVNVLEVAREIEKAGADALTVHARLAVDGRDVPADWSWISKVKKSVKIPVIGNGDIFSGEDAERMLRETKCDGVMIARGAIGDHLIFSRILEYFKNGKEGKVDIIEDLEKPLKFPKSSNRTICKKSNIIEQIVHGENLKMFKEYLKLAEKYDMENSGNCVTNCPESPMDISERSDLINRNIHIVDLSRIKYLGGKFIRGFDGAARVRNDFVKLKSFEEIKEFVDNL